LSGAKPDTSINARPGPSPTVIAPTAIGLETVRRPCVDLSRATRDMTHRSPTPSVPHPSFPRQAPVDEQLTFLLGYAVMAPSGHNTQPWQFSVHDASVWLYVDPARTLPALDPGGRERIMSCGAALFHFRIAMRHVGITPEVEWFPDRDEEDATVHMQDVEKGRKALARISMGSPMEPTLADETLFSAIQRRRTHREAFEDATVPTSDLNQLQNAAASEGANLEVLSDAEQRSRLLDLVVRANEDMLADADVRRELAEWTASASEDAGVPGSTRGWSRWQTLSAGWLQALPGLGPDPWHRETATIRNAPVLTVLTTTDDNVAAWLRAGQALDHVLLRATSYGLGASFLNQPVKVSRLRQDLRSLCGDDAWPQIVLRMGVATTQAPQSGRRPIPIRKD